MAVTGTHFARVNTAAVRRRKVVFDADFRLQPNLR
jgi:hypothetical protein